MLQWNPKRLVRYAGMLIGLILGLEYSLFIVIEIRPSRAVASAIVLFCMLGGAVFGYLGLSYITLRPFGWIERRIRQTPVIDLISAVAGLTIGLFIAAVVSIFVQKFPFEYNILLRVGIALFMGYTGMTLGLERRAEILSLVKGKPENPGRKIILDPSVILDGRLFEICRIGFIRGILVVPHFVLVQIQDAADSEKATIRDRGKKALISLEELQQVEGIQVLFPEDEHPEVSDVGLKLIQKAKELPATIFTAQEILIQQALLYDVPVISLKEVTESLRPVAVPGVELQVAIIKNGKDRNQAIGYLDDGTMVVVEEAREMVGKPPVRVRVTSSIQRAAGRMIFAKLT